MNAARRIVTSGPENSETPLEHVPSWVTPNRLFFVRNHFEPPAVADARAWELTLEGLVTRAHSNRGEAQPFEYNPDNLGYLINIVRPTRVRVQRDATSVADFADPGVWSVYMEAYAEENRRRPLDVQLAFTAGDGI